MRVAAKQFQQAFVFAVLGAVHFIWVKSMTMMVVVIPMEKKLMLKQISVGVMEVG